jgi:diguanylate cyclase (GGDEF)-like protein
MSAMKKPLVRALQGAGLSFGSPAGWLVLQGAAGGDPWLDLLRNPGVYAYMLAGTAVAFAGFGWFVGRQEEHYRERALHDALTGLYNRRYFWRRLDDEVAFARRHGRPLALLVGDLDRFKGVNDAHGHAAGDEVLRAVAAALMEVRRRGDTVARIGGEEFAVILPETDAAEAVRVAERMRQAVAALSFQPDLLEARPFAVTISVGAAAAPPTASLGAAALLAAADAAMYRAKQAGRNRVEAGALGDAAPGVRAAPLRA